MSVRIHTVMHTCHPKPFLTVLKVVGVNRLPTAHELTGDDKWDLDGALYQMYDLGLDSGTDVLSAESGEDVDLHTYDDSETVENSEDEDDVGDGVKVLNHRTNEEVKEMVRESSRRQREEYDPDDPEIQKFADELDDILKPYISEDAEEPVEVNNHNGGAVGVFPELPVL